MSDIGRNNDLREALEKAIDAEHAGLLGSVPAEELQKAPSPGFRRRMDELFREESKKRLPLFWRRAALAAAMIAAVIGLMALFGVFSRRPNGEQDVHSVTPLPTGAPPPTAAQTGLLPPETAFATSVPVTAGPEPSGGATPVPYLTPIPPESQSAPPTDAPITAFYPSDPPGSLPPVTPGPTQGETPTPPLPTDGPTSGPTAPPTSQPTPVETASAAPTAQPPVTEAPTGAPITEPPELGSDEPITAAPTSAPYNPGDVITLGRYEQDNNIANGAEDIEWIVLSVRDRQMLVLSRYALDAAPFDEGGSAVWSSSSIRNGFLNGFYNTAFSASERVQIRSHYNQNPANPDYDTPGESATLDRVFLLGWYEVALGPEAARRCVPTAYARSRGVAVSGGYCRWWLRTPGGAAYNACFVDQNGAIDYFGCRSTATDVGVRPAMWISFP